MPLRLSAADAEDLAVVSTLLQDAIVPLVEMAYLRDEESFVFVASRFAWEETDADAGEAVYQRVNCAVRFDGVEAVQYRDLDRDDRGTILSLLAIQTGEGYIELIFSGGGAIRLAAARIACRLDDLDHSWPTRLRPTHGAD